MDRNVDPASTMQVVNALIKADKDFDLLVIPGAGHGAAGTPYGRRRQQDSSCATCWASSRAGRPDERCLGVPEFGVGAVWVRACRELRVT